MSFIANKSSFIFELKAIVGRVKFHSGEDDEFFSKQSLKVMHLYDGKKSVDDILQRHLVDILKSVLAENELVPGFLIKQFRKYVKEQSQQELISVRANQFLHSAPPDLTFSSVEDFITTSGIDAVAKPDIVDDFCSRVKSALNEPEESCDSS